MEAALAPLQLQGIRILNFIDDFGSVSRARTSTLGCRPRLSQVSGVEAQCHVKHPEDNVFKGHMEFDHNVGIAVSCTC